MSGHKLRFHLVDVCLVVVGCFILLSPTARQFARSSWSSLQRTFTGLPVSSDWVFLVVVILLVLVAFLRPAR